MIKYVRNIMISNFEVVNLLDGVQKVMDFSLTIGQNYFPVLDNDRLVGVITICELLATHPNRIIADAMSKEYVVVSAKDSIWSAVNIIEENNADFLFVIDKGSLVGVVKRTDLLVEISKYFDPLTCLYKSNYLYYQAGKLIKEGKEISIIFIDINNFGQIDKEYGHARGDTVLKELALILKESIRKDMFLCRYGGDEFVILSTYSERQSKEFSIKLQSMVSSKTYSGEIELGISVGIAGGRRGTTREEKPIILVRNLLNLASLASTQAKTKSNKLHIEKYLNIESTA